MKQAQNFAKKLSTKVGQPTEAKISKNLVFHWFLEIDTFFVQHRTLKIHTFLENLLELIVYNTRQNC